LVRRACREGSAFAGREGVSGASRRQAVSLETINEAVRQMDAASADSSQLAQEFSSSSTQAKARAA
jgi:methyl-accepting chemotaxis protein